MYPTLCLYRSIYSYIFSGTHYLIKLKALTGWSPLALSSYCQSRISLWPRTHPASQSHPPATRSRSHTSRRASPCSAHPPAGRACSARRSSSSGQRWSPPPHVASACGLSASRRNHWRCRGVQPDCCAPMSMCKGKVLHISLQTNVQFLP